MEKYIDQIEYYPIVGKFSVWIFVNIICYFLAKLSLTSCECSSEVVNELDEYIVFHDDSFDIEHKNKNRFEKVNSFITIIKYCMIQFYFANVFNRIHLDLEHILINISYLIVVLSTIIIFGVCGQIRGLQTSWSCHSIKHWPIQSKICYSIVFVLLLMIIIYCSYLSYLKRILIYYLGSMIVIILFYVVTYVYYLIGHNVTIHVHHWFLGFMLCGYLRFDTIICNILYSIFYGIFIQGSVAFGTTSIFKD